MKSWIHREDSQPFIRPTQLLHLRGDNEIFESDEDSD